MRNKEKSWKLKAYSLSEETIEKIKEGAVHMGLSQTAFIEYLVMQHAILLDPIEEFNQTNKQIKDLRKELEEKESKQSKIAQKLSTYQTWLKEKQSKRPEAIKIIKRKIDEEDHEGAERVAKAWSKMLGISPLQLISEAIHGNN